MAQRVLSKVLAAGVMASAILSSAAPATAQDNPPSSPNGKDCVVAVVDGNGNTIRYDTVPEGTVIGLFHCSGGEWRFGWFPFDSYVSGKTGLVHVDEKGSVTDAVLDVDAREGSLSVQEMQSVVEKLFGERVEETGPVYSIVTERDLELSAEELGAVADGRDVDGVKVVGSAEARPESTVRELGERAGGGEQSDSRMVMRVAARWTVDITIRCWRVGDRIICHIRIVIRKA